ncbi:MAG: cell surface protein SprA, partial [Candidatus Marinimicrobia bacterium]|nr:cell surface protein SprA [Candidatus Neomarinimicrobiota bacterium]
KIPTYILIGDYYKLKYEQVKKDEWNKQVALKATQKKEEKGGGSLEIIGADIAGQRVSLRVNGNISISGKYNNQSQDTRYTSAQDEARSNNFILDQTQSFNIEGRIGDRISMKVHQDSESNFDFEDQLKIFYTGKEDEIIQRIDAGNIGLSLPATKFVSGKASNSGLYGIKALAKLGPIDVTTIASVEKGQSKVKTWGGGSEGSSVQIFDYQYMQDTYFYLDEFYLNQIYPLNDREFAFDSYKIITDINVYISCIESEQSAFNATAFVNPNSPSEYDSEKEIKFFKKLEEGKDYQLKKQMGILKILTNIQDENVIAIAYKTDDGNIVGDYVEKMDEIPEKLKLIRHSSPKPEDKTYELELKNVYNLGARGINQEGFDLKIYYDNGNVKEEGNETWASYLQLFGLDINDENLSGTPDGKIDISENTNVINLFDGELWLPFTYPFEAEVNKNNSVGIYNTELNKDTTLSSSLLYHSNRSNMTPIKNESKFFMEVTYSNRSDFIQLNDMMIIEGSEEITMNGNKLTKGVDYEFDYFAGSVQLISSTAKNPNGELKIKYDAQQLFQLDKKTIAGMRAEYKFGTNSFLGGTFMYYNKSSLDDQVRIGEEPFKNYIWDINGQISFDLDWMTRAINFLPLIETTAKSSIKIDGEVAQIIPNPNTISNEKTGDPNGVAKIDDFEGVKRVTSMGIMYKSWKRSAKPTNNFFDHTYRERGFLYWYNPYNKIKVTDIWPNKETANTQDNGINILNIVLDPEVNGITGDETRVDPRQTWGGIIKPLYSGAFNQTQSKYIEVWAKGETGTIQIDIGQISEDIDGDYMLDTEDDTSIVGMKNDIIDEEGDRTEDIGLNGLTDEEEIALGIDPLIDNFIEDKKHPSDYLTDYRHYNGTEGNKDETAQYPDTEDLNRNSSLETVNSYFTYELNLSSNEWIVSETEDDDGKKTGWKLYRIPLNKAVDSVGNADLVETRFMRLSFGNVMEQDTVKLASIAIVGNEWQELGITDTISDVYKKNDEVFAITVVNTEENSEYTPPEGVEGKLDKINNIRAKEQSLCMNLNGLPAGQEAGMEKLLYKDIDLLTYKQLKMYVHGDYGLPIDNTPISLSLRLGRIIYDNFEYYEIETPVYRDWDERNEIVLDFEKLAELKLRTEFDGVVFRKPYDDVREYHLVDEETGELTGQVYRIVGNNISLSRLKKIVVAVKNNDSFDNYTGNIWI